MLLDGAAGLRELRSDRLTRKAEFGKHRRHKKNKNYNHVPDCFVTISPTVQLIVLFSLSIITVITERTRRRTSYSISLLKFLRFRRLNRKPIICEDMLAVFINVL